MEWVKQFFDLIPDIILLLDKNLNIIWRNNSAKQSTEFNSEKSMASKLQSVDNTYVYSIDTPVKTSVSMCDVTYEAYLMSHKPFLILLVLGLGNAISQNIDIDIKSQVTVPILNWQTTDIHKKETFVSESKVMQKLTEQASRISRVDTNVLITGETGVGKTFLAKFIHSLSPRKESIFVTINAAAIPPTLLESELFGYEKNSFTGADKSGRQGLLEIANQGTVFLDEIGELPINLQAKILQAIEEKNITRIGARKPINLDIRIIAATNRDLAQMVKEGNFRSDLYYRLNVITFTIPPLRSRPEDIPPLINHFLSELCKKYNVSKLLSDEVMSILIQYDWPGNIRELQNAVEQMVIISEGHIIETKDIVPHIMASITNSKTSDTSTPAQPSLRNSREAAEREIIVRTLQESKSVRQAARKLNVSHATLLRKMQQMDISSILLNQSENL